MPLWRDKLPVRRRDENWIGVHTRVRHDGRLLVASRYARLSEASPESRNCGEEISRSCNFCGREKNEGEIWWGEYGMGDCVMWLVVGERGRKGCVPLVEWNVGVLFPCRTSFAHQVFVQEAFKAAARN